MELGKMKISYFHGLGWLSVILALFILMFINISLLSGYKLLVMDNLSLWLFPSIISGVLASFNKKSRSLGLWGLGLCAYIGLFFAFMFVLGWMIVPFP